MAPHDELVERRIAGEDARHDVRVRQLFDAFVRNDEVSHRLTRHDAKMANDAERFPGAKSEL